MTSTADSGDVVGVGTGEGGVEQPGRTQPLEAGTADGGADLGDTSEGLGFTSDVGGTPPGRLDPAAGEQTMAQSAREAADREADAVQDRQ